MESQETVGTEAVVKTDLDISREKENEAIVRFLGHRVKLGECYYYEGSGVEMSHLDGILTTADYMVCAVEVKWRRFSYEKLMQDYNGELMIPATKVLAAQAFALAFSLPTRLFCLLDDCLLVQEIVDESGKKINITREVMEEGKRNIDGGNIRRKHSYVQVEGAEKIPL